ncbi:hypothetical protein JKF63_07390 [Porcisia hertigi]|uniref:Uncharacterized protein n=1 Tax=Porcisia hertigi TaxID=2761500 RepID=A0A836YHR1_9TRYP|nr:hypothetical protein JKF63_07390 [Porcisia hertigi]
MPHLSPHVDVPEDFSLSGKGAKASDAASSEVAPPVARPASTFTASPPLKNTSLIQRSCVAQSVWSGLLDDSMRPLGAHRRVGPAMPSASQPLSSPRAASTSAAITGATSVPVVTIEVAVVASAASSPPGLALLELYENVWKRWCSRNGRVGSKGVARRDSQSTQPTRQTWHTDEDLATVFDLVERIPLTTVDTVTVGDIKCEVEWRTGLPAAQQCLAYDAISLHDCLPVHLLLSTADQYSNKSSDGSVGAERDAAIGEEAGDVCLRFVCVPLSSDSSALMMAAAPWNDRVGLSPRASSQSTAGDDCANTPARGRASMSAMSHDANKSDRGGVITSPSRNSMSSIPPDTRAPVTAAAAAAAAAPPRDPQRRPGAVSFMSSYGTTTTAPAATSHIDQAVSMHISRMRRVYLNHAGTSDQSIREGEGEA